MYEAVASEMPAFGGLCDDELDLLLSLLGKAWAGCAGYGSSGPGAAAARAALI